MHTHVHVAILHYVQYILVLVPEPKPTSAWITFSITHSVILEAIYTPDEVGGWDKQTAE